MDEQKLRQLFKNRSNCYADADDVVQAMDENCFVETVKEVLRIHNVVEQSEQCSGCEESTGETKLWCCNHCGKRIEDF